MPSAPPPLLQGHAFFDNNPHRYAGRSGPSKLWLTMSHFFPATVTLLVALQFVAHFSCVDAVNLRECGTRLQDQLEAAAGNTSGNPPVLLLSYEECLVECGSGIGDINWQAFSPNFGAWLLPWISLMFQIPFGAEREFHDLVFTLHYIK